MIFESKPALAALVARFSLAKLREVAAAARALARYVEDLEVHTSARDDVAHQE